jgi:mannose-6-phosphate isomerase-like protein (cupin superfamily)
MKTTVALAAVFCAFAAAAEAPSLPATDISSGDIQAFLKALPRDKVSDLPIRTVDVGGYHVGVFGVLRPKSVKQEANLHETRVTEVYQILDGAGTLVTGGTLIDSHRQAPGSTNLQGSGIQGGVSRRVTKGDVIIIPGRTPHWFSNLESDLTYLITRPDPDGKLKLK